MERHRKITEIAKRQLARVKAAPNAPCEKAEKKLKKIQKRG
jgi:hypothetical protein